MLPTVTKWLITTPNRLTADELQAILPPGANVNRSEAPIPLGDTEQACLVEGPADLDRSLPLSKNVLAVSPVSPVMLY